MTWLFPFFLAAGAAIIAPILLHLRRQPPQTRVDFSSLMFLAATPIVTSTRRRFERWLLLLLRCLALLLLAAMFARPFIVSKDEVAIAQGRAIIVLVDRSGSMQQGKQWASACAKASEWIGKFTPQDYLAVGTVDRVLTRRLDFEELEKKSKAERQDLTSTDLEATGCSYDATHLDAALREAVSWLAEANVGSGKVPAEKRIILISDLQEGAHLDALRGFAWPDDVTLTCDLVKPANVDNLSISLVAAEEDTPSSTAAAATLASKAAPPTNLLRLRLANARDAKADAFALRWNLEGTTPIASGQLPAGATRVLRLPLPASATTPPVLELSGDSWDFDNRVYMAPPQPRKVSVVCLTSRAETTDAATPLFYLSRALQPSPHFLPTLSPLGTEASQTDVLKTAQWLVLTADYANTKGLADATAWIEQGGQALCSVGENFNATSLTQLLGHDLKLTEAEVKNFALLADFNVQHPVLRPFQDARLRDFSKIHVWHYRRLASAAEKLIPGAEVIARFDNGDPAWLAIPRGKGRIVLMLHGWHPRDSQLALSSRFVPLLYGLLAEAGIALDEPVQFVVGDVLPVPSEGEVTITPPKGDVQTIKTQEPHPLMLAKQPGFYKITSAGTRRIIAVNLPPEESRITPMDVGKLTALGVRLHTESSANIALVTQDKQRLANEVLEDQQQYWLIALALLLWVLGIETWLAGRRPRTA